MSGRLIWAHSDSVSMQAYAQSGWTYGLTGNWPVGADGNRAMRAWLMSVAAIVGGLGPKPLAPLGEGSSIASGLGVTGTQYLVQVEASTIPIRSDWQALLSTAVAALVSRGLLTKDDLLLPDAQDKRIVTMDGDDPLIQGQTVPETRSTGQIGIIEGIVIVACTGLLAGALGWIVSQYSEVSAIQATADSKSALAISAITTSAQVVENHIAREVASGASLNWEPAELQFLGTLQQTIRDTAGWKPPEMKSVPNVAGVSSSLGSGIGVGTAIGLAVVAWLLLKK